MPTACAYWLRRSSTAISDDRHGSAGHWPAFESTGQRPALPRLFGRVRSFTDADPATRQLPRTAHRPALALHPHPTGRRGTATPARRAGNAACGAAATAHPWLRTQPQPSRWLPPPGASARHHPLPCLLSAAPDEVDAIFGANGHDIDGRHVDVSLVLHGKRLRLLPLGVFTPPRWQHRRIARYAEPVARAKRSLQHCGFVLHHNPTEALQIHCDYPPR